MILRRFRRAVALVLVLALCFLRLVLIRMRGPLTLKSRALWMQSSARLAIRSLGIRFRVQGRAPTSGLLVANHLSYLDIIFFSAALPCCFVAKAEIATWPFFGMLARAGGTLFVDRSSRVSAEQVTEQVAERLRGPVPVLFFPEGTSTDGSQLLRFHSRLYNPAAVCGATVTAASITYMVEDGTPERELCWFGNALFLPHVWKTLGIDGFSADVQFGVPHVYTDRRQAADATHTEIAAMRSGEFDVEVAEVMQAE
jgi:1-acyl-sn-glycerol-3-phosphate acyltransferase